MKIKIFPTILLMLCVSAHAVEPGQLAENQSRFGVIEGDVGFLPLGAKEWQVPHEGLPFEPGDHIRTADNSRVELQITNNVLWVLDPESEAVVEDASDHEGRVDLVEGTILGIVDTSRISNTQHWVLNTPAATVVVHGTQFALTFSVKDGSRLGVFQGEVEMQAAESAAGDSLPIRVAANEEGRVTRSHPAPAKYPFSPVMRALRERRQELKRRQARVQEDWSYWNPADRSALRKKYVAPPPKARPTRPRVLKLRGDLNRKGKAASDSL
jgi:hypothetical protein